MSRHHQPSKICVIFKTKENLSFSQKPIEWLKANKNIEIKHFLIFLLRSKKNTLIQSKTITFFLIGSKIIFNFYFTVLTFLAFSINSYPTFHTGEVHENRLTFTKQHGWRQIPKHKRDNGCCFLWKSSGLIMCSRLRILYTYTLIWITA